jgi:phospholipid/cholesterol/gamma-HCH transport system substrate-binding protein
MLWKGLMEKRFKFRHVNELTGLLVLLVLALVVSGLVFSEQSQRWFTRKYSFDVLLPEQGALGLCAGADVIVLGVSAGMVGDITVGDDGRMTARVKIRRDFVRFVRVDSTASIKKVFGVAGDSFLEITRGTGAALSSRAPEITCLVPDDSLDRMEKMLADLHSEMVPVVKEAGQGFAEWTKLGGELRENTGQLHELLAHLDNLAIGAQQGKGTVGKLLSETTLADESQKLLLRANEAMGELQEMETNLAVAVKNVQNGSTRLPEITDAVANEARDLPGLVSQTQMSMRELERLIEALQRNWFVRKYVNKTNPPPLRPLPETVVSVRKPFKR